jgi:hypothetical protein
MIAALELDRRLQRAAGAVAYLAVNVVIAILGICAVVGVMLGAALSVIRIGLPLLLACAAGCRWLLRADRRAANRFLRMQIPPQPAAPRTTGTPWRRTLAVLSDRMLLRTVLILAAKPLLIAVLVAVAVMLVAADPLAAFIHANPTVVMLALGFLLMIGMALIADGFGAHVPKGYIYAAMAFSALIEGLNMLARRARKRRDQARAAATRPPL